MESQKKSLEAGHKIAINSAIRTKELEHKAEVAELSAQVKQKTLEIESLHKEIDNLRSEVASQRKLTQAVAEASKAPPITQSFGK